MCNGAVVREKETTLQLCLVSSVICSALPHSHPLAGREAEVQEDGGGAARLRAVAARHGARQGLRLVARHCAAPTALACAGTAPSSATGTWWRISPAGGVQSFTPEHFTHCRYCRFVLRCSRGVMRVAGRTLTNQVAGLREEQEEQGGDGREAAS